MIPHRFLFREWARPTWAMPVVAVVMLALVAALFRLDLERIPPQSHPPQDRPHLAAIPRQPGLLIVGDSFAAGADPNSFAYPVVLAEEMGWSLVWDVQGGTGFLPPMGDGKQVIPPPGHVPFGERLDADFQRYHPDYVVIDGGRNDLGKPPDQVVAAQGEYLRRMRTAWPWASIAIVIPQYLAALPAVNYPLLVPGMTRNAQDVGAYVVDPVADGWYQGVDLEPLFWSDEIHPNGMGSEFYADHLATDLKKVWQPFTG